MIFFCYSAKTQKPFSGISSICSLCQVKSCVNNPAFHRQSSLPDQHTHPVHVKLICNKHALHEVDLLLSNSESSTNGDDYDDSFHEKYLDISGPVDRCEILKGIGTDPDFSPMLEFFPASADNDSGSIKSYASKTENIFKKTEFKINDWEQSLERSNDRYNILGGNKSTRMDDLTAKDITNNNLSEEGNQKEGNDVSPHTYPQVPPNTPDTPTTKHNMFLKCKSRVDTPPSALPPSDYGERTHVAAQPCSQRPPFSRSLSNADVQPHDHRGESCSCF